MIDPRNFYFNSNYLIDKVLEIFTGSFTSASRISPAPVNDTKNTSINDLLYYVGTYTVDGGEPQDIGSEVLVNGFVFQVLASTQAGTLQIYSNNADTISHEVTYKIALISKPSNTLFTLNESTQPINDLYFSSSLNYQKIALEDVESVSVAPAVGATPTDTLVTIPHDLGYIPCVRAFVDDTTTLTDVLVRNGVALVFNIDTEMTNSVDESNVYFRFTNLDTNTYSFNLNYRIYYDAN